MPLATQNSRTRSGAVSAASLGVPVGALSMVPDDSVARTEVGYLRYRTGRVRLCVKLWDDGRGAIPHCHESQLRKYCK